MPNIKAESERKRRVEDDLNIISLNNTTWNTGIAIVQDGVD